MEQSGPPACEDIPTPDAVACLNAALTCRYRVASEIGEGGMAMVYLAEDVRHERKAALKVLKPVAWEPAGRLADARSSSAISPNDFVRVTVGGGTAFEHGSPEALFEIPADIQRGDLTFTFDIAPDGQRFLMANTNPGSTSADDPARSPSAILVNNVFEELRRLVPR